MIYNIFKFQKNKVPKKRHSFTMLGDAGLELLSRPRYRPPTPVLVKSEKKVKKVKKKWKKWCFFWSLNLFIFGYVKGGVLGNNNIGIKKCTSTFLCVEYFLDRHPPTNIVPKVRLLRAPHRLLQMGVSTVSFDPTRALSTAFQVIRFAAWATPAYK